MSAESSKKMAGGMAHLLQGKTVLVTRPRDQAQEFAQLLEERGARVVFIPTIEIVAPQSWHQFDDAIKTVQSYDAIIFTSANGVREFFRALNDRGTVAVRKELEKAEFYAVGTKTGEFVLQEGFTPIVPSGVENGQQLADALSRTEVKGKKFLFPRGNLANQGLAETLRSHGAQVDEIVVYETVTPRNEDARAIRRQMEDQSIDVITFFSPSSVKNLLAAVPKELFLSKTVAVIGPTTESAVIEAGLEARVVAPQPTSVDLVNAIVDYFNV